MTSDSGQTTVVRTIGRYRAFDELGRGAMGVVYRGFDPVIGRAVALKTLLIDPGDAQAGDFRERLYREAAAAGALSHPNIVTIFDIVEDGQVTAVAMEFIEGQSLAAIIRDSAPLPLDLAVNYLDQICSAIDFAAGHGIVHRDIKPPNIIVTPKGRVKVTDFGVARLAVSTMTHAGTVLGSPSYMSPEQVRGLPLDGRSDVFSAVVVFYEMITRERPFGGNDVATTMYRIAHEPPTPPGRFNAAIGPDVTRVLERAFAKEPDHRFRTGAETVDALRRVMGLSAAPPTPVYPPDATMGMPAVAQGRADAGPPRPQPPVGQDPGPLPAPQISSPPDRSRTALLAGAGVVVLAAAAAGIFMMTRQADDAPVQPAAQVEPAPPAAAVPPPAPVEQPPATAPQPAAATPATNPVSRLPRPAPTTPRTTRSAPPNPTPPPAEVAPPARAPAPAPAASTPPPRPAAAGDQRVYSVTDVDERPKVLNQVEPVYPADLARRGIEDVVVLKVLVARDGRAEEVQVLRGSRKDATFDRAAIAAVQQWVFAPARKGGEPVASWYNVGVPFQLKR